MKKIILIGIAGLISLSLLPMGVIAHGQEPDNDEPTTSVTSDDIETKIKHRQKTAEERAKHGCEITKARLTAHLERSDVIKDNHNHGYKNLADKLLKLADRVDEAGVDTIELREEIATLEDLITDFVGSFGSYDNGLAKGIAASCDDKDELKQLVSASRQDRQELRTKREAIKDHLKETILPELKSIKSELAGNRQPQEEQ